METLSDLKAEHEKRLAELNENLKNPRLVGLSECCKKTWSETMRQDRRWWFNSNIKPLLEKMIMVWDLFHGEYEAY